jgi:hypothetical protein
VRGAAAREESVDARGFSRVRRDREARGEAARAGGEPRAQRAVGREAQHRRRPRVRVLLEAEPRLAVDHDLRKDAASRRDDRQPHRDRFPNRAARAVGAGHREEERVDRGQGGDELVPLEIAGEAQEPLEPALARRLPQHLLHPRPASHEDESSAGLAGRHATHDVEQQVESPVSLHAGDDAEARGAGRDVEAVAHRFHAARRIETGEVDRALEPDERPHRDAEIRHERVAHAVRNDDDRVGRRGEELARHRAPRRRVAAVERADDRNLAARSPRGLRREEVVVVEVRVNDVDALALEKPRQPPQIAEIVERVAMLVQPELLDRLDPPRSRGAGDEVVAALHGPAASEQHVVPRSAKLRDEIHRRLRRAGPLPVREQVENSHSIVRSRTRILRRQASTTPR